MQVKLTTNAAYIALCCCKHRQDKLYPAFFVQRRYDRTSGKTLVLAIVIYKGSTSHCYEVSPNQKSGSTGSTTNQFYYIRKQA